MCKKCPSSTHSSRLVEPDGPFARCGKLPCDLAQCRAGAGWPGWEGYGAAQPHRDQLEEQGHACEERQAEGKLQEQFSSMRETAVQRKDVVWSPYPLGIGQSLKFQGGRSPLDTKKTHPHSMMRPGACLGCWGIPGAHQRTPMGTGS